MNVCFYDILVFKGFFSDLEQEFEGLSSKLLKPASMGHLC